MDFFTPALLAGAALIAVPIALHLVMRRQPKQLMFPAMQFVRSRQAANRRNINLRHLLLLLLRCALIAGFAIALARPSFTGSGLKGKEGAPLAVALVLDNSLRMQYVHENQTRQDQAKEMAKSLIGKLPQGTEIAVIDRSRASGGFAVDLNTAESRLRNLAPESKPRPLEDAVREAIELVSEKIDSRQEIFLFSDLNATVWNEATILAINETLAAVPEVRLYLVDVGVEEARNMALGPLELRKHTLRPGQPLQLNVPLEVTGFAEAPLVDVYLNDAENKAVKRGQQIVELTADGNGQATFELGGLPLGTHQGYVHLAANDPLEVDNKRFFTVEVRPAAKILLLGKKRTDALFLHEALSPSRVSDQSAARFECQFSRFTKAEKLKFADYAAICLLDPPPLTEELWQKLVDYVNEGGGLGLFLGERTELNAFAEETVAQLMPGKIKRKSRHETYFRPQRLEHPALAALSPYAASIPWQAYPVYRYWEFETPLAGDTHIVARFADKKPALMVRTLGQGRVLTLATPISDALNLRGRDPWNLLPAGAWPFVPLMNEVVGYLAQSESDSLTFQAGETISLHLPPNQRVSSFVLYQPDGQPLRRTLPPGDDTIRISSTHSMGNYRVSSGGETGELKRGFSINLPAEVSRLERIPPTELMNALTNNLVANQVEFSNTLEDVERVVDLGRSGRELFPYLITLVALIWGSEHLLANRFYRGEAPA